jgi:hypothetical protein
MRGDKNWTAVNEIEHWAWEAYGHALNAWLATLPDDHEAHDMDPAEQCSAFLGAHPDGWPRHPDDPQICELETV